MMENKAWAHITNINNTILIIIIILINLKKIKGGKKWRFHGKKRK